MKSLCISNIAWDRWDDAEVFALLRECGVQLQELAPAKVFGRIEDVSDSQVQGKCRFLREEGFGVPAFQAILFGRPDLQVFDPATHIRFLEYLKRMAHVAFLAGARVLVFGAPKNRRRYGLPYGKAMELAKEFFRRAGEVVVGEGCCLGIEANPAEYACDFLTNTLEVCSFVKAVASPGVRIHLDTGAMTMNHECVPDAIAAGRELVHFHVSEPMLKNPADGQCTHGDALRALRDVGYAGAISIEMKQGEDVLADIRRAITAVVRSYHDAEA